MDPHAFIAVIGFIVVNLERSIAFQCFACNNGTSCKEETFYADAVPTVECNTTCVTVTTTLYPGFKEVFRLFDKNSDSSISTEEAAKVLTLVGEIEENSNMTGDEFQGLFSGYNSEAITTAFAKLDKNSDVVLSAMELGQVLRGITSNTTEAQLQERMNSFNPDDCWEDFHKPGCSDPMDDPEGKFENMVQCFCSSDKCNGATQSDGGTTPKNSDQTRTTQTTSVGLTETTNNGSRLTQPNGDQAQTTQTTSVGLTETTNNGSTETSGSPAQTTTSSATAKNHNSLQAVIVSEFVLFLCFNGHFINS